MSAWADEEPIGANNAAELERKYQAKKRNRRLGKADPVEEEDDFGDPLQDEPAIKPKGKGKGKAKAKPKAPKKKVEIPTFAPEIDFDEPDDDYTEMYDEDPDELGRIVVKCRQITQYYEEFPKLATKKKWNPEKASERACDAELARLRHILDMQGARPAFDMAFAQCFSILEKATHEWGWNPFNLEIRGIGDAVANPTVRKNNFEHELTEAYIELGGHFASSWEARLAFKCVKFVTFYSAIKKDPVLQKKMEEQMKKAQEAPISTPPNEDE